MGAKRSAARAFNYAAQNLVHRNGLGYRSQDQLFLDARRGFVFNRVKKNANTFVMLVIHRALTGEEPISDSPEEIEHLKSSMRHVSRDFHLADLSRCRSLVVVRDPRRRALSAFLDKFSRPVFQQKFGRIELTPDGFSRFVSWLEDGGLARDPHWGLQTRMIAFPMRAYTDVIPFERLDDLLPDALRDAGYDISGDDYARIRHQGRYHATRSDEIYATFVPRDLERRLAELYRPDLEEIGLYD